MTTKLVPYPIVNYNGAWHVQLPGLNKPLWEAVGRVDFDHSETKRGVSYYVLFGFLLHDPPVKCWFREPQEQVETEATEPVKHYSCDGCALDVAGAIECHDCFGAGYIRRNYTPAAKQPEPDVPDFATQSQADAWSTVYGLCRELGMKEMVACTYTGVQLVCEFVRGLAGKRMEMPVPIPKPTPEQLKAIGKVLDGDAPRKCKKGDCVWNDSPGWCIVQDRESDMGLCGKLRWHLKNAPPAREPDESQSLEQARAWSSVYDLCLRELGMFQRSDDDARSGIQQVCEFIRVLAEKFVPESTHAAECEGLIKRLVAWPQNDYREFDAIMTEARRLYPEAK